MIITHKLDWKYCLSHRIFPAIEKGWKDEDKEIHFFWGLAGQNTSKIKECIKRDVEWWYVDTGYLTEEITRYPKPSINNFDKTYFRICKGFIHTQKSSPLTGQRLIELETKGIDTEFRGWDTSDNKRGHILIAPSSPTVCHHVNGINQDEYITEVSKELRKYTDREIVVRNKPRPNNKWWGTDIKDELKGAHCLVTNMSLSSISAILNQVPVLCHSGNVASPVSSVNPKFIEKPFRPGRKTIKEWLKAMANNQFTLAEIESGIAYKILHEQN